MKDSIYYPKAYKNAIDSYFAEVSNTLKYTLRINEISESEVADALNGFDYKTKTAPNEVLAVSIIEAVKKSTDAACQFLFQAIPDFFGSVLEISTAKMDGEELSIEKLAEILWRSLFNDALLSVYSYLRKALCGGAIRGYSAYKISHFSDNGERTGLDYALEKNWLWFSSNDSSLGEFKLNQNKRQNINTANIAGNGSPFCKRMENIDKSLIGQPGFKRIVATEIGQTVIEDNSSSTNNSKYWLSCDGAFVGSAFDGHKARLAHLVDWVSGKNNPTRSSLRNDLGKIENEFRGKDGYCISDSAYLEREIENLFHGEVLEDLWISAKKFEERNKIDFAAKDYQTLALCMKLPLTPERTSIIRYALDFNFADNVTKEDFFSNLGTKAAVIESAPADKSRSMELWMERYRHMMYYLADFAYPVYRSCFFTNLYKAASTALSTGSTAKVILYMYDCLRYRINYDHANEVGQDNKSDPLQQKRKKQSVAIEKSHANSSADKEFGAFYKNCNTFFREFGIQNRQGIFLTLKEIDYFSLDKNRVDKLYDETIPEISLIPDSIKEVRYNFMKAAAHYTK